MSLSYLEEGRDLMGGFVFAVLLCFKHLFAVVGPVYFVELLPVVLKRRRQRINKFIEK
jgi:alpha-1,3-glucosyltransferase